MFSTASLGKVLPRRRGRLLAWCVRRPAATECSSTAARLASSCQIEGKPGGGPQSATHTQRGQTLLAVFPQLLSTQVQAQHAAHMHNESHSSMRIATSARPLMQSSFVGAVAVADMVKTTLGPKGMVRMRSDGARSAACCKSRRVFCSMRRGSALAGSLTQCPAWHASGTACIGACAGQDSAEHGARPARHRHE